MTEDDKKALQTLASELQAVNKNPQNTTDFRALSIRILELMRQGTRLDHVWELIGDASTWHMNPYFKMWELFHKENISLVKSVFAQYARIDTRPFGVPNFFQDFINGICVVLPGENVRPDLGGVSSEQVVDCLLTNADFMSLVHGQQVRSTEHPEESNKNPEWSTRAYSKTVIGKVASAGGTQMKGFNDTCVDLDLLTTGMGQRAGDLPPNWRCYTEIEVERIILNYRQAIFRKQASEANAQ